MKSCPTLCDPVDCSLPGSSVHGILQARILEWVAISFSRDLSDQGSNLGLPHCRQTLYHLSHQGSRKGGLKLWNREKCFSFLLSCSVFSRPSHLTAHLSVLSSWLKYALKITNWHNCIAFPPNWFSLSLYTPHTHTHIFFCFTPFSHFITQCSGLVKRHISHALVENVYVLIRNWRSLHWSPVSS